MTGHSLFNIIYYISFQHIITFYKKDVVNHFYYYFMSLILIYNEYFFLSHLCLSLDIATIPNSKNKLKWF